MTARQARQAAEAVGYRLRRVNVLGSRLADSIQGWGAAAQPRFKDHQDHRGWDVYVEHPRQDTVDEWTYLYSEAIHHLRSSLDNMVWALAEPTLLTPAQQRNIRFPILSDERRWHEATKKQLRSVPEKFMARVYEAQPFHAAPGPETSPLTGLQDLSNADKHRLRVRAVVSDGSLGINARFTWPGEAFGLQDSRRPEPVLTRHDWGPDAPLHHSVRTRDEFLEVAVTPTIELFAAVDTSAGPIRLTRSLAQLQSCVGNTAQWVTGENVIALTDDLGDPSSSE